MNAYNVPAPPVTVKTTAGAVTYTPAEIVSHNGFGVAIIKRDPNGSARTDVFPTAALLKAYLDPGVQGALPKNFQFELMIVNTADASEQITMSAGTGGTTVGTMTIAQSASKRFIFVVTSNPEDATLTYDVYDSGAFTS